MDIEVCRFGVDPDEGHLLVEGGPVLKECLLVIHVQLQQTHATLSLHGIFCKVVLLHASLQAAVRLATAIMRVARVAQHAKHLRCR